MKVILQQDVRGQGKKDQMIDAAEGYARNYLLPRKLAIPATADAINTMNLKEKARRAEEAANRAAAVETADKLRNCTVKITAKGDVIVAGKKFVHRRPLASRRTKLDILFYHRALSGNKQNGLA